MRAVVRVDLGDVEAIVPAEWLQRLGIRFDQLRCDETTGRPRLIHACTIPHVGPLLAAALGRDRQHAVHCIENDTRAKVCVLGVANECRVFGTESEVRDAATACLQALQKHRQAILGAPRHRHSFMPKTQWGRRFTFGAGFRFTSVAMPESSSAADSSLESWQGSQYVWQGCHVPQIIVMHNVPAHATSNDVSQWVRSCLRRETHPITSGNLGLEVRLVAKNNRSAFITLLGPVAAEAARLCLAAAARGILSSSACFAVIDRTIRVNLLRKGLYPSLERLKQDRDARGLKVHAGPWYGGWYLHVLPVGRNARENRVAEAFVTSIETRDTLQPISVWCELEEEDEGDEDDEYEDEEVEEMRNGWRVSLMHECIVEYERKKGGNVVCMTVTPGSRRGDRS